MKHTIEKNRRMIIIIGAVIASGVIIIFLIKPLWSKVSSVSRGVELLNNGLSNVRKTLKGGSKDLKPERHPISRREVSVAINEIMEVGVSLDIDFFATSPQQIQISEGSKYPVLPIRMELQSSYKNFGMFLGALENLSKSIVTVKQFSINRKPILLPEIIVELVVEIHLKEGEGG